MARRTSSGLLHLSEGPIDLLIKAKGEAWAVERAEDAARLRFEGLLGELVAELGWLRRRLGKTPPPPLQGPIARRMAEAAWPYRDAFVTPMVAVAGAVAEAVLCAMVQAAPLRRAFVNNGGDIALHLTASEHLDIGVIRAPEAFAMAELARPEAFVRIDAKSPVRGIATSGRHGRSFSLGIADAVTVLARTAAGADAAATMIANAVDLDDPAIRRRPACELDPDSDLGEISVVVDVGALDEMKIAAALRRGRERAEALIERGLIEGALLSLHGRWESVGAQAKDALALARTEDRPRQVSSNP
ncbi:MAG: UPF0280 family protein [Hyphomicrobiales bacterium]|nr:UPF0280 family protein [Hyphomicrobiales bacterium]MBV9978002.1 UPF0280 family protein [Hyphomicrobiales bacterium]